MMGANETDDYGQLAENIWQCDHKKAPKDIYHYCTSEGSISIIENNSFWASAFECMNDNKEFRHGMALAKSEVNDIISTLPTNKVQEMQKNWCNFIDNEASSPLLRPYVISFCEDPKNQHLWKEYSSNHQGTLLQISNKSCDNPLVNGVFLRVFYDEVAARAKLKENLIKATNIFNSHNINRKIPTGLNDLFCIYLQAVFRFAISLKEAKWHKEKEWRFVVLRNNEKQNDPYGAVQFRHRETALIDYLVVNLQKVRLQIDKLILGSRFPEQSINSIKLFLSGHSQIQLCHSSGVRFGFFKKFFFR